MSKPCHHSLGSIGILTFPGLVRLKAVVDGRMVGFIGGEPEPARRRGWVTTLGVLPAFRRKGIALALLQRCEHELAMPIIRLSVRASNEAAIGLYEFAGYKISDRWAKYYIGGEDALIDQYPQNHTLDRPTPKLHQ